MTVPQIVAEVPAGAVVEVANTLAEVLRSCPEDYTALATTMLLVIQALSERAWREDLGELSSWPARPS